MTTARRPHRARFPRFGRLRAGLGLVLGLWLVSAGAADSPAHPGYADESRCTACHAPQVEDWSRSHHARAMQPATAETVLGDFADARYRDARLEARFHRRDDTFLVTVTENGHTDTWPVAYTFGIEPLQQYLLRFPDGRWQAFPIAWDVEAQRWFPVQGAEPPAPDDPLHWRKRFFTANSFCVECHTTDFQLRYDLDSRHYRSRFAQGNVGCQACHGPATGHLAWLKNRDTHTENRGFALSLSDADIDVPGLCGRCHARRHPLQPDPDWGLPLTDRYQPALLQPPLYYADGQIHDEVYVYGSFRQSRMHQAGVTCSDCHNPHSGQLRRDGNALCTGCHQSHPPARFATLQARRYDTPDHHHHAPGQPGAACVDCHMPATVYMGIDARRDHRFGVPQPALSRDSDIPNACNRCHTDRDAAWAVAALDAWFPERDRHRQQLPQALLARDRAALRAQLKRPDLPAIWRATVIAVLGTAAADNTPVLRHALAHDDPLVRTAAVQALAALPATQRREWLTPRLADTSRAVRLAAVRAVADTPPTAGTPFFDAWQAALTEYRRAQQALPDHPEGYTDLGQLALQQGNPYEALRQFRRATAVDPQFAPAWQQQAVAYSRIGAVDRAEAVLQDAIPRVPDNQQADLYFSLGLAQAESGRPAAAIQSLRECLSQAPEHVRAHYNLGLLYQQQGDTASALAHLQAAYDRARDERTAYALALAHLDAGDYPAVRALLATWAPRGETRRWQALQQQLPHGDPDAQN